MALMCQQPHALDLLENAQVYFWILVIIRNTKSPYQELVIKDDYVHSPTPRAASTKTAKVITTETNGRSHHMSDLPSFGQALNMI